MTTDEEDIVQKKLDKKVKSELRKLMGNAFMDNMLVFLRDSGETYNYRIGDRHIAGEYSFCNEPFDDLWVTCNFDGNEMFGQMSVGLHNGKYFSFNYCSVISSRRQKLRADRTIPKE